MCLQWSTLDELCVDESYEATVRATPTGKFLEQLHAGELETHAETSFSRPSSRGTVRDAKRRQ